MRLGENSHKRPQGSHKMYYIKKFRIKFKQFLINQKFSGQNICTVMQCDKIFSPRQRMESDCIAIDIVRWIDSALNIAK